MVLKNGDVVQHCLYHRGGSGDASPLAEYKGMIGIIQTIYYAGNRRQAVSVRLPSGRTVDWYIETWVLVATHEDEEETLL